MLNIPPNSLATMKSFRLVLIPLIVALVLIGAYAGYFGIFKSAPAGPPESWGQFGDFLGGLLNPVVGIVTIILLVQTLREQQRAIAMQSEELALQRNELKLQRAETAKSTAALDAQHKAIVIQSLEQTFFTWLDSYTESLKEIQSTGHRAPADGPRALKQILFSGNIAMVDVVRSVVEQYQEAGFVTQVKLREFWHNEISDWWSGLFRAHESSIGVTLRILLTLIQWIDNHPALTPLDRWNYISILRARLSTPEIMLLYFNGITAHGEPFKPFIDKYALLDRLQSDSHSHIIILMNLEVSPYPVEAFHAEMARAIYLQN